MGCWFAWEDLHHIQASLICMLWMERQRKCSWNMHSRHPSIPLMLQLCSSSPTLQASLWCGNGFVLFFLFSISPMCYMYLERWSWSLSWLCCDNKKWEFIIPCSRNEQNFLLFQTFQFSCKEGWFGVGSLFALARRQNLIFMLFDFYELPSMSRDVF